MRKPLWKELKPSFFSGAALPAQATATMMARMTARILLCVREVEVEVGWSCASERVRQPWRSAPASGGGGQATAWGGILASQRVHTSLVLAMPPRDAPRIGHSRPGARTVRGSLRVRALPKLMSA